MRGGSEGAGHPGNQTHEGDAPGSNKPRKESSQIGDGKATKLTADSATRSRNAALRVTQGIVTRVGCSALLDRIFLRHDDPCHLIVGLDPADPPVRDGEMVPHAVWRLHTPDNTVESIRKGRSIRVWSMDVQGVLLAFRH